MEAESLSSAEDGDESETISPKRISTWMTASQSTVGSSPATQASANTVGSVAPEGQCFWREGMTCEAVLPGTTEWKSGTVELESIWNSRTRAWIVYVKLTGTFKTVALPENNVREPCMDSSRSWRQYRGKGKDKASPMKVHTRTSMSPTLWDKTPQTARKPNWNESPDDGENSEAWSPAGGKEAVSRSPSAASLVTDESVADMDDVDPEILALTQIDIGSIGAVDADARLVGNVHLTEYLKAHKVEPAKSIIHPDRLRKRAQSPDGTGALSSPGTRLASAKQMPRGKRRRTMPTECHMGDDASTTSSDRVADHGMYAAGGDIDDDSDGCEDYADDRPNLPADTPRGNFVELVLSEPGDDQHVAVPPRINQFLRPYQRDGVKFMYKRYVQGQGAVLADDMGLGKTIQIIALLAALFRLTGEHKVDKANMRLRERSHRAEGEGLGGAVLIACPVSLVGNWKYEIETWVYLNVAVLSKHNSGDVMRRCRHRTVDVVIASFESIRRDCDSMEFLPSPDGNPADPDTPWHMLVVDEVHFIKNHKSQRSRALARFPGRRRFGLSGTVLQNSFNEYFYILDFLNPGCLGTKREFTATFASHLVHSHKTDATEKDLAVRARTQEHLHSVIQDFYLRRDKRLIADQMPQKTDHVVFCKLTGVQQECYNNLTDSEEVHMLLNREEPCDCRPPWKPPDRFEGTSGLPRKFCCYRTWKYHFAERCDCNLVEKYSTSYTKYCKKCHCEDPEDYTKPGCIPWYFFILPTLTNLQKAANHLGLILQHDTVQERILDFRFEKCRARELEQVVFKGHPEYLENDGVFLRLSNPKVCCKMDVLLKLMRIWQKEKAKVLLFSHSTKLLSNIELILKTSGIKFFRLDGSTKPEQRLELCQQFNADPSVQMFLISTRVGATGLNLPGANKVVIFDPSWNPAHDLQAQDRAFRIGQKRNVAVYRFIAQGTIEEKIYGRQLYKQQLANMSESTDQQLRILNESDFMGIDNLMANTTAEATSRTQQAISSARAQEYGYHIANYDATAAANAMAGAADNPSGAPTVDEYGMTDILGSVDADIQEALSEHGIVSHTNLFHATEAEGARVQQALGRHTAATPVQTLQQRLQFVRPVASQVFARTEPGRDTPPQDAVGQMAVALARACGKSLHDFAQYVVGCTLEERQRMTVEYHSQYVRAPPLTVNIGCDAVFAYGLGSMPLGVEYPDASRKPDRSTAIGIVTAFAEACATQCADAPCFIDTADTYCTDESDYHAVENLLSTAKSLQPKRQLCIATKGGMQRHGRTSNSWRQRPMSAAAVKMCVRASADHLGEPIFLWQLHHCDGMSSSTLEAVMLQLRELQDDGVILHIGICNASYSQILKCDNLLRHGGREGLASVQNEFSLWKQAAAQPPALDKPTSAKGVLQRCKELGIAFIPTKVFGGLDARRGTRDLVQAFPPLAAMAQRKGVSAHALTLAYIRHKWPNVVHIPGVRTQAHAIDIATAATVTFTHSEIVTLDAMKPTKRRTRATTGGNVVGV
eukprot:m.964625 g.964625  ORF g.964625 m.964625 type:complete len:1511 (-) comp23903_c0_seq9:260-4792(-)